MGRANERRFYAPGREGGRRTVPRGSRTTRLDVSGVASGIPRRDRPSVWGPGGETLCAGHGGGRWEHGSRNAGSGKPCPMGGSPWWERHEESLGQSVGSLVRSLVPDPPAMVTGSVRRVSWWRARLVSTLVNLRTPLVPWMGVSEG